MSNLPRATLPDRWSVRMASARAWEPPAVPTVVVAPHPDDEVLGAGGLIAYQRRRGVPVDVVAITDGDPDRWAADDFVGAMVRRLEREGALASLGVDAGHIHRLGVPAGQTRHHAQEIESTIRGLTVPGGLVVAPWRHDLQADHEACGREADAAARRVGAMRASYVFWGWHDGPGAGVGEVALVRVDLDDELRRLRFAALERHGSGWPAAGGPPVAVGSVLSPFLRHHDTFVVDPLLV